MRAFARPMGLDRLSLEARVLYTAFCLFLLVGMASSAWLYVDDGLGLRSSDVTRYYRGDDASAAKSAFPASAPASEGGPALDLPPDDSAPPEGLRLEKPARQVMETFHFHLFSVPVCLLIVGHIFMMSAMSTRKKVGILVVASVLTLLHLMGPLLVRFGSSSFSPVFIASAVGMTLVWSLMLVVPLVQMWMTPPSTTPPAAP
jgi:hypothetical protein